MLQIEGMKLSLEEDESLLAERAAALLRVPAGDVREVRILRRAVDAREGVHLVYTLHVGVKHEAQVLRRCRNKKVSRAEERSYRLPEPVPTPAVPPVVVGAGPGGLFCALALARCGARPILLERGWNVERFWSTGTLDTESNVQFGEGGAGAFSDGKLNTGTRDPRHRFILETLVSHGAPESILYDAKPHVGTDYLHKALVSLRRELWDILRVAGVHTLFCGVGDCLALAVLVWVLGLFPASFLASYTGGLAQVLLLMSPLLYAALSLLTSWKDVQTGIREWTWTFRISSRMVNALRMLCFGAASVLVCVPANLLVWIMSGRLYSLSWMLSLSLASLFLYGALSLFCQRMRGMAGLVGAPACWVLLGLVSLFCPRAAAWLAAIPTAVFCLLAAAGVVLYLLELRRFCRRPMEGGLSYALR